MSHVRSQPTSHAQLAALIRLSDFDRRWTPQAITQLVKDSPDPETVAQAVLQRLRADSPALRQAWRQALVQLWAASHPDVPALPELPLTDKQAVSTFQLLDALAVLNAITRRPARLVAHAGHFHIHPNDIVRLQRVLESADSGTIERLRATLEAAHLLRPYRGQLQVVRSHLQRFLALPRSYQFYVLWHTDVYHVAWATFALDWQEYVNTLQDYLPLLWDLAADTVTDATVDKYDWCLGALEAFVPIWTQNGLLTSSRGRWSLLSLFHQCTLPTVLNQLIINDLFARYGLIQFEPDGNFIWTPLGTTLIAAEREHSVPCALELL